MFTNGREGIEEVFHALQVVVSRLAGLSFDALTTPERLVFLERLEQQVGKLKRKESSWPAPTGF